MTQEAEPIPSLEQADAPPVATGEPVAPSAAANPVNSVVSLGTYARAYWAKGAFRGQRRPTCRGRANPHLHRLPDR